MPAKDALGYYRELGVEPSASAAEIKAAFRRLAKEFHPDKRPNPDAAGKFRRIAEAYRVIGDADRRADYDNSSLGPEPETFRQAIEPTICMVCKKVTAQPRYIIFRRVISLIALTTTTPIQGIYCANCAFVESIKASSVSAILGWWAFPWGPIRTIQTIVQNASGGERPLGMEQRLLWLNAVAFLGRGNLRLSYALAKRVIALGGGEPAERALQLIADLSSRGVAVDSSNLKNPWAGAFARAVPHLLLMAALPVFIVLALSTGTNPAGAGTYVSAGTPESAQTSESGPVQALAVKPPATCAILPASGQILGGFLRDSSLGHKLEIQNGSDGPVIVKVRDAASGRLHFSFFVGKGETGVVSGIPDGAYRIQYAIGTYLSPDCQTLGGIQSIDEFPDVDTLSTRYTDTEVVTQTLSYTLYRVPGGNVAPQSISAEAFDAS